MVTDEGESLHLVSDHPAVVEAKVCESVRRWRWRKVIEKHRHLSNGGQRVQFEPVQKIRTSKLFKEQPIETTRHIQSGLRSAVANRQWPQLRCHKAGYTPHNRCWLCAAEFFKKMEGNSSCTDEQIVEWLESEAPGNFDLPVGSIDHRLWQCPFFAKERIEFGSRCMSSSVNGGFSMAEDFRQAHST